MDFLKGNMAKNRFINTKMWEDGWFSTLDPIEKLFFIYLLTNPMTNIAGCYEISKKTIGVATGLEQNVVEEILSRFERDGKVCYRDGWLVIFNFIKHQNYKSPKIVSGLKSELENIPKNIAQMIKLPNDLYGIDTVSHLNSNSNSNSNSNPNRNRNSKKSTKVDFTPKDMELSKLLLDRIKKNTPTYKEPNLDNWANDCRLMRERDNRTPEQIEHLIEWSQKDDFWSANILSMKKVRDKFDTMVAQMGRKSREIKNKKQKIIW